MFTSTWAIDRMRFQIRVRETWRRWDRLILQAVLLIPALLAEKVTRAFPGYFRVTGLVSAVGKLQFELPLPFRATLVSLPQVLSIVAILQMSKVRRRELRNPESCRIEDLSHVAVGYSRMGILSQWTRVGSIMVGEPSMGVMSRHPSREDCTETLAAGSRDSTWAPGGAGGSE